MKSKLAILGASYLQRPLFEKAKQMGIETHCFAWEDGAVCKDICDYFYPISVTDKEAILEVCSKVKIDGITTIATDISIPTISYVAEKLNLIANSFESSLISTNKGEMRKAFHTNNINSPKFKITSYFDQNIEDDLNYPIIVKPIDRSGSRGVTMVLNKDSLEDAVLLAIKESITGSAVIEEFIEGYEVSVESISFKGNHKLLAITDKITTNAPHFVELEHHQPSLLSNEIKEKIEANTICILESLQIKYGASHTEFKITTSGKIFVIEVGARMGGDFIGSHLVELSTGFDYLKAVIDIALNKSFEYEHNNQDFAYSGVYFLSKETEKLLPYFKRDKNFIIEKKIMNNKLVNIKNSNDRSGYLIYKSQNKIIL